MAILIITYDLKVVRDYTPLFQAIQRQGAWWHYLASTWLVDTDRTPQQVVDDVHQYMAPQDSMLVAEMGSHYQGWLPKEAWDWINSRMYPTAPQLPFPPITPVPPFIKKGP